MGIQPGIQTFATGAGVGSRIAVPKVGDQYINMHNGALLIYYGAGIGWKQVWSLPWGQQRSTSLSTVSDTLQNTPDTSPVSQGGGVTFLQFGFSFPGALGSIKRQYQLTFDGTVGSTVNGDVIAVSLNCDTPLTSTYGAAAVGKTQYFAADKVAAGVDSPARMSWRFTHDGNAFTGRGFFYVSAYRFSGTGAAYLGVDSAIHLDDLGPSTPPY